MQQHDQKNLAKAEENKQVKEGKKAIEMGKATAGASKSNRDKKKDEEKDAEAWHNEG